MALVWDDLDLNGLGIYRDTEAFAYGHDAVLLASFARFHKNEKVLDLGTGTGILALLVHAKTGARVDAVDISAECCQLAQKSVERNGLCETIRVFNQDIRSLPNAMMPCHAYDGIICNPPYHAGGTESPNALRSRSTHQTECTIEDAAVCAARMLKNGGKGYFCYPVSGLSVFCAAAEKENMAVKRIRFVRSKRNKAPYLFLAEVKKGGGAGLILEDDTILED